MSLLKNNRKLRTAVLVAVVCVLILFGNAIVNTWGRTQLEFDIQQNQELILFSTYGEPPQFAIWLENPETGQLKTVFVTYRSAQGDWEGKAECPGSLPLWFEIFKREYDVDTLPGMDKAVPVAITGATPQAEHFKIRAEVPRGSEWICWIEVNLAGDYNEQFNTMGGNPNAMIDESGQASVVYKTKITSEYGSAIEPEIIGQTDITQNFNDMIRSLDGITTATDIFKDIKIKVIRPKPALFKWSYKYKNTFGNL